MKKILLLGVGNVILSDEGVGVHALHYIKKNNILIDYLDYMDGATGGHSLVHVLLEYDTVILIDATLQGKKPGQVSIIKPRYSSDYPMMMSAHDFGLKNMIDALGLFDKIPQIYLVLVTVEDIHQVGLGLSKEVEKSVPMIIEALYTVVEKVHQISIERMRDSLPPIGDLALLHKHGQVVLE